MSCRTWVALASAAALVFVAGCSLQRGALGASGEIDASHGDTGLGMLDTGPRVDTGVPIDTGMPIDGGGGDGGGGCTGGCDDGNPCTDDACTGGSCAHTPNTASCNDGVLCNGADTCSASTCSVHDGVDPCTSPAHCDVATDTCLGCRNDGDCPADILGGVTCDYGTDLCANTGTGTQTVQTFTCTGGACVTGTTTQSTTCTRVTDGTMCAAPMYGLFSACDFGTDVCAQSGTQSRTVTISACSAGSCAPTTTMEMQACTRTTDGTSCGMPMMTTGACTPTATCSTSGTQTTTTTMPTCMSGACAMMASSSSTSCTLPSTDGTACGTPTCGAWSACTPTTAGDCSTAGTQSRTCSSQTCMSGACTGTSTTTQMQACTASVVGNACMVTTCGNCHEPSSLFTCRTGHMGVEDCATSTGTCQNGLTGLYCQDFTPSTSQMNCTCP